MDRLRMIERSAWVVWLLGFAWQGTMIAGAGLSLAGYFDGIPSLGHPLSLYVVVALVSGIFVMILLVLPYGGDWGRRLRVWTRAFGWQAAVGSVLAFSIGLATRSDTERTAAFGVGFALIIPALLGVIASLLSEAHDHHSRRGREVELAGRHAEILAEIHALRESASMSATEVPRLGLLARIGRRIGMSLPERPAK